MNILIITGNLGSDAEQRYTQGGDSIVSFSVPAKSGFGEKAVTSWIRCSMFGKRGESVFPYLKKGQLIGVQGEFAAREWTDKEGQKRISNEMRVNDLQLLGKSTARENQEKDQPKSEPLENDIPW